MTLCQMVLIFCPTLNFSHFYAHSRHFTLLLGVPWSLKAFLCLLGANFSETEIPMVLIFSLFHVLGGVPANFGSYIVNILIYLNIMIPLASFHTFWTFLVSFFLNICIRAVDILWGVPSQLWDLWMWRFGQFFSTF